MKIAIIGAGAIGSLLAVKIHQAGHHVTLVARGETGQVLRRSGICILSPNGADHANPPIAIDTSNLEPQDAVFIAVKGHSIPGIAKQLRPLAGPDTLVISAINGVPWWFGAVLPEEFKGYCPPSIASHSVLNGIVPLERTVGCVVFPCSNRVAPGVFSHLFGDRFILGFPDSSRPAALLEPLAGVLTSAGFTASISNAIGADIWSKLIGNLAHNPVSAITGATCDVMLGDEYLRGFCTALMQEANEVGVKLGFGRESDVGHRNDTMAAFGPFKTSMLQDVERRSELELDSLVFAVKDLAVKVRVKTPMLDSLIGLLRVSSRAGHLVRRAAF